MIENPISERVVAAVAQCLNRDRTDVGPLYDVINPDALDSVFENTERTRRTVGYVYFEMGGVAIRVMADGTVEARRIEEDIDHHGGNHNQSMPQWNW